MSCCRRCKRLAREFQPTDNLLSSFLINRYTCANFNQVLSDVFYLLTVHVGKDNKSITLNYAEYTRSN